MAVKHSWTMAIATAVFGVLLSSPTLAETTECTEITAVPTVITVQGVYCFKQNLVTSNTSGVMIDIQTNNVVIDLNGWKLGGSAAGTATLATGIHAQDRKNITIKNGSVRGYMRGIQLSGNSSSGHTIENIRADQNRNVSIQIEGSGHVLRNNSIVKTGDGDNSSAAYGIRAKFVSNTTIIGNLISGVSETGWVYGIEVSNSTVTDIRNNSIFDLGATVVFGVFLSATTNTMVTNNRIINNGDGTTAIFDSGVISTGVDCIGNEVFGYTNGSSGCDYSANNDVN